MDKAGFLRFCEDGKRVSALDAEGIFSMVAGDVERGMTFIEFKAALAQLVHFSRMESEDSATSNALAGSTRDTST
eukprot:CAMPEP_0169275372 /NCGR_PEP_ID=MMETSP1016-20121227/52327_1 /TAXON_ID=342587 /ORGANISM="Karlodinium micrum, Strain CCMP2283" /LENGTH=74 /DNA_ID=CAMNT_0009362203 /DNA_START=53 /DNA_END=274 /DNA_ORIENTATION=+